MSESRPPHRRQVLLNGLRKRCPRCGRAPLFRSWYTLFTRCPRCDLDIEPSAGDTWGFMYSTTAVLTGTVIVGMLLVRPASLLWGTLAVGGIGCTLIFGTLPRRKAMAIALDYLTRTLGDHPCPSRQEAPPRRPR